MRRYFRLLQSKDNGTSWNTKRIEGWAIKEVKPYFKDDDPDDELGFVISLDRNPGELLDILIPRRTVKFMLKDIEKLEAELNERKE